MFVLNVPPPSGQFEPIHDSAAADAAASELYPEPLLLPEPILQNAVQAYVWALLVLEVPPPCGQLELIQVAAAFAAADCELYPVPPLLGEPPLHSAVQLYSVVLLGLEVPPPAGQFELIHVRAADNAADCVL